MYIYYMDETGNVRTSRLAVRKIEGNAINPPLLPQWPLLGEREAVVIRHDADFFYAAYRFGCRGTLFFFLCSQTNNWQVARTKVGFSFGCTILDISPRQRKTINGAIRKIAGGLNPIQGPRLTR